MAFYKDERIALFIDGANLYSAARAVGLEIDFRKLLKEFQGKGRLLRANYYTALVETDEYSPIRPLVDWLAYNGYSVVKKPAREFTDQARARQHGCRTGGRHARNRPQYRSYCPVQRKRRLQARCRGGEGTRRSRLGRLDSGVQPADDLGRSPP